MQSWHLLLLTAFAVYGLASSTYSSGKCEVSWSSWSSWSRCNRRCGLGVQQRHRSCISKGNCAYSYNQQSGSLSGQSSENDEHPTLYPSDDNIVSSGETPSEDTKQPASSIDLDTTNNNTLYDSLKLLCPGVGHEVKKCFKTSCNYYSWTSWGSWSDCTQSCGGYGRRYRSRKCEKTYTYAPPRCVGSNREEEACGTKCCPVDATWGSWSPFSLCTRSCGGGYRVSTRICIKAKCGGKDYCEGKYKKYIPCNAKCCPKPPYWGDWQDWSQCSKKCGGGISYRRRRCYQSKCPDPYQKKCTGNGYEEKKCNEQCCPEKPYWGEWEDWSVCSKKCGGGISYRKRKCIPSKCPYSDPRYNKCYGSGYEEKKCNQQCCPEKPYWGEWEDWSVCSKKCGGGISYRKRTCIPSKCPYSADPKYNKCDGSDYEEKKCNDQCCPEKPYWGDWEDWSVCSKKCGGGISYRKRKCIPSKCPYSDPKYNKCYGSDYEEKKCNNQCCPEKPYWGEWKDWSVCSKKCGGGISYRKRKCIPSKCPYSDPKYNKCYGSDYEEKKCNEQCCPEKPYWGDWEDWSVCSKKCGGGISYRKRKCYQSKCPHPYYKKCDGSGYEEKKCNEHCCPEKPYWGEWEDWTVCSKKCGGGISYRKRKCVPSKCPYSDPKYNKCYGSDYEEKKCNEQCCPVKPYWGDWEDWSVCSKKCGGGISYRKRKCIPSKCPYSDPQYNKCYGSDYEEKKCNVQCCPEKPYWGDWEDWSVCTKTCGSGITYRRRKCYQSKCPHPYYKKCDGIDYEEKKCNEHCCPEKPYWGEWEDWSVCSKKCGGGISYRKRKCIPSKCPHPYYKTCQGNAYEEKKCNDQCCPEKPYWGEWEDWSVCSKKCGGGISYRKRKCYQSKCPHPYYKKCDGSDYEEKKCNEKCCPEKPYWGEWEDWSVCSKKCGGGISYRKRKCIPSKCPYSDPRYNKCYGSDYEEKKCNNQCCPEKPYWGEWEDWTKCSKKCGGGISYRKRKCIPSKCPYSDPKYNKCDGSDYEEKKCNNQCCPEKPYWGEWEDWTKCSKKCGGGISYRKRKCIPSKCPYSDPKYNKCDGSDYEEKKCNNQCCPEKPYWGEWEDWTKCSKKCGGGISYRKRKCIPSKCPYSDPKYNKCYGSDYEEKKCNEKCCPEKPYWGEWEDWSVCSKKCGGGISYRKRKCIPSKCPYSDPKYNKCYGNDYEEKKCNVQCCPEKPYWGEWEHWSVCDKKCGGGISYRKRKCIPSKCPYSDPKHNKCYGNDYEEKKCNEHCCPEKPYWGEWKEWSVCSKKCGGGISYRKRKCIPSKCPYSDPKYNKCDGSDYEEKKCNDQCCPEKPYWGEWDDWTVCSKKCGGGISYRKRKCIPSKCPYSDPAHNKCDGKDYEEKKCNEKCCQEPDYFGEWSNWSKCSSSCGKGKKYRKRLCYKSKCPTDYRGCKGKYQEYADCDSGCCPKDGYWSSWTSWSDCSVSCGYGQQRRERTCHEPECGGKGCYGSKYSAKACYNACETKHNFYYTSWSSWSDCSKSCGEGGTRTRTRHCVDYTQYHKDAPACPEKKQIDTDSCFIKDCPKDTPTDKPTKGDYYDHHH